MKLEAYLKTHEITHEAFAASIGCEQPTVTRFVNGARIPSPDLMRAIAERTAGAVTANDFFGISETTRAAA